MKGTITKAIGGFFFVADEEQNIYKTKIRGKIQEKVYPGDRVRFNQQIIEEVYPRENLLIRPSVANIEQVLIVMSLREPVIDRKMLDRFLLVVEAANLVPIIIINKVDLVDDQTYQQEFNDYFKAGYQVFFVSIKNNYGLDSLQQLLSNKINVLTGPSGVGKSSLINYFINEEKMPTQQVSKKLKRGIHTTRHVELLPLDAGGWVADTPGFSSLNINQIPAEELTFLFPEFDDFLGGCKFRGCSHTHEPGCAIKMAVEKGEISKARYQAYTTFLHEILN